MSTAADDPGRLLARLEAYPDSGESLTDMLDILATHGEACWAWACAHDHEHCWTDVMSGWTEMPGRP